ncbi:MAG: hypothetical protein Q7R70_06830, partial [Candidatus Diapherotrites archaeon]|nr:hypothetical protein [Candidatus Diapherotrites archaeon]
FQIWKDQTYTTTKEKDWLQRLQEADVVFLETLIENYLNSEANLETLIEYFKLKTEKQNEVFKNIAKNNVVETKEVWFALEKKYKQIMK